jgi:hypothetical protein
MKKSKADMHPAVSLAATVLSYPVIGCGETVPTQRDNQDLGHRVKKPLNLLERQLVRLGDIPGAAVRANLKIRNGPGACPKGGVSVATPAKAPRRVGDKPDASKQGETHKHRDELSLAFHAGQPFAKS